jgi:D-glycero-D-manno-heptose 1,7-bisphosphate phosphatase
MRPAIFLDRDGVLIENRDHYVRTWEDVAFFAHTFEAMRRAATLPHAFVVVSNQAGVGKGLIDYAMAEAINLRVAAAVVENGGRIDRAYFCPHRADAGCDCRKPRPGMLLRAARELDLDLAGSWMIGDNITDMQAGSAAGTRCMLVRTGLGDAQLSARPEPAQDAAPFDIADNLADALNRIARTMTHTGDS